MNDSVIPREPYVNSENWFLDTEFEAPRNGGAIRLISLGLVHAFDEAKDYYVELDDVDAVTLDPWLQANVVPHLSGPRKSREVIRGEIQTLFDARPVRVWAYYGAYDWTLFCELMGGFQAMPRGVDKCFHELRDIRRKLPVGLVPPKPENAHNALADAQWNRQLWHKFHEL